MYEIIYSRTFSPVVGEPQYPAWDKTLTDRLSVLNRQGKGVIARKTLSAKSPIGGNLCDSACLHIFADAWTSGNPGLGGCRVVNQERRVLVHKDATEEHSNNYFELYGLYLAADYASKYYHSCKRKVVIWSDSQTALAWVKSGECEVRGVYRQETLRLIAAVRVLQSGAAFEFRKWETARYGEIPADYGRK